MVDYLSCKITCQVKRNSLSLSLKLEDTIFLILVSTVVNKFMLGPWYTLLVSGWGEGQEG